MARKTIKGLEEIIQGLEDKLSEYRDIILDRNKQVEQMESVANDSFENSTEYKRLIKEIRRLETIVQSHQTSIKQKEETIKSKIHTIEYIAKENYDIRLENEALKEEIELLKQKANSVQKIKNERGAGRKTKINNDVITRVTMLRLQGKSIRAIAREVELSVGTVHKILNEPTINLQSYK